MKGLKAIIERRDIGLLTMVSLKAEELFLRYQGNKFYETVRAELMAGMTEAPSYEQVILKSLGVNRDGIPEFVDAKITNAFSEVKLKDKEYL